MSVAESTPSPIAETTSPVPTAEPTPSPVAYVEPTPAPAEDPTPVPVEDLTPAPVEELTPAPVVAEEPMEPIEPSTDVDEVSLTVKVVVDYWFALQQFDWHHAKWILRVIEVYTPRTFLGRAHRRRPFYLVHRHPSVRG